MRRIALLLLLSLTLGALVLGRASSLSLGPGSAGAGSAKVLDCDTNGFGQNFTTASGRVSGVFVSGIADPACEGGSLTVTLSDSGGNAIGTGASVTVPTDAGTTDNLVFVGLSLRPPAPQVASVHISISGP